MGAHRIIFLSFAARYGADAQQNTHLTMHTARNVVLVYVDMRGFARRALLQKSGMEFVKARIAKNKAEAASSSGATTPAMVEKVE